MKTILSRHYVVEYVVPESPDEDAEIKRIIKEVEDEQGSINLSDYKMVLPDKKS
jgi:hypothetical protein